MTKPQRATLETILNKLASGLTRHDAEQLIPPRELDRLIDLGMILEIGDYLELREGVRLAS